MSLDILTANDEVGSYPASFYAATARFLDPQPSAEGEMSCDVCVIGGGFAGLSAALHAAQKGLNVVLLEAHRVGFGASGRNGGQVGTGQRIGQDELEPMVGKDKARVLWDMSLESVQMVKDLAAAHAPDATFYPGIIHADHRARFVQHEHDYAKKLQDEYGYGHIRTLDQGEVRELVGSDNYYGGTVDTFAGHIHPLNYALGLARAALAAGVRICETSRVQEVVEGDPATVVTEGARIKAGHVLWACNGYLGRAQSEVARRVMPINNFIVTTEPLGDLAKDLLPGNHAVADSRFVINYFRLSEDGRMIFGGGETYGYRFPDDIAKQAGRPMVEVFPQLKDARIDYAWGGTLGITMSRLPHFARLSKNTMSTSGFSGHGVAMATLSGKIAAEALTGAPARFDLMEALPTARFPGGPALRPPLLALAMIWYSLRDRF